jgi:NADH dehydrogenase
MPSPTPSDPHVVIVGGGFAGLTAARTLRRAPVRVTLVDHHNHHVFQPLLYQVATAGLSSTNIAAPLRHILRRQRNATILLAEATGWIFATSASSCATARCLRLPHPGRRGYPFLFRARGMEP